MGVGGNSEVETYIIVTSARGRMLLGSLMKTAVMGEGVGGREGGRERELCGQLSSRGWRRCKLLGVKRFCANRQNIADSGCFASVKGVGVPVMQIGVEWVLLKIICSWSHMVSLVSMYIVKCFICDA